MAIFGSSRTELGSRDWSDAELAGRRFAEAGLDVATGGYGGTMEAASSGASRAGGKVVGVTLPSRFPGRAGANSFVAQEIEATSLLTRIEVLTDLAVATLVLPGSIGTAAELVITWNLNHISRIQSGRRIPTAIVGEAWAGLCQILIYQASASGEDIHAADTVEEAIDWLLVQPEVVEIL